MPFLAAQEFLDRFRGALRVAHALTRGIEIAGLQSCCGFLKLEIQPRLRFADIGAQSQALPRLLLLERLQSVARGIGADGKLVELIAKLRGFRIRDRARGGSILCGYR